MKRTDRLPRVAACYAAAALIALSGCSNDGEESAGDAEQAATEPSGGTLINALADADELSRVSEAIRDAGLSDVFDGAGAYTIFAPTDAAFAEFGEAEQGATEADRRALMAAVLRDHIVPGYLTTSDIEAAIDAQGGSVRVETMGDHMLRFTRAEGGLKVTSEDGSSAMISGDALRASNGVAIPLDGVLKNSASAEG